MPSKFIIIKGFSATSTGRIVAVWNVADAVDDYIYDTFDRRGDALAWIKQATETALQSTLKETLE